VLLDHTPAYSTHQYLEFAVQRLFDALLRRTRNILRKSFRNLSCFLRRATTHVFGSASLEPTKDKLVLESEVVAVAAHSLVEGKSS